MQKLSLKSLYFGLLLASTTSITAKADVSFVSATPPTDFHGPYIGFKVGRGKTTINGTNAAGNLINFYSKGFVGGIYGGYNHSFVNQIVIGGEIYFNNHNYAFNRVSQGSIGVTTLKINPSDHYGIAIKLGYKVTPKALAYVRGGFERAFVKRHVSYNSPLINRSITDHLAQNLVVPGIGFEVKLTDQMSLRAEYEKSIPKKIQAMNNNGTQHKWRFERATIGLTYHF